MSDLPRFETPAKITAVLWYWDSEYRGIAYESRDIEIEYSADEEGSALTIVLKDPSTRPDLTLFQEKK